MRGINNLLPRVGSVALAAVLLVTGLRYSKITEERIDVKMSRAYAAGGVESCGHSVELPIITRQATATQPGELEYKCASCGALLREEIIPITLKRERPLAVINTETCTLINIPDNSIVSINGNVISFNASERLDLSGKFDAAGDYVITVIANENELAASDPQAIYVFKPSVPGDIQTLPAVNNEEGLISGVGPFMEYKLLNSEQWSICSSGTQPLSAGTYQVRIRATATSVASDPFEVVVGQVGQPTQVVVPPVSAGNGMKEDIISVPVKNDKKKDIKKKDSANKSEKADNDKKQINNTKKDNGKEVKEDNKEEIKKEEANKEEVNKEKTEIIVDNPFSNIDDSPISVTGEKGWDAILDKIERSKGPVIIIYNGELIPSEVLIKAAEANVPLVFTNQDGITWSIQPADINIRVVKEIKKINLSILDNSDAIPKDAIATIADVSKGRPVNKIFSIMHNGILGFTAELKMKLKNVKPGEYANLFLYDDFDGALEYIDSSVVNDESEAIFKMSHASNYVIVMSKDAMSQDSVETGQSGDIEDNETKKILITQESHKKSRKMPSVVIASIIVSAVLIVLLTLVLILTKSGSDDLFSSNKQNKK